MTINLKNTFQCEALVAKASWKLYAKVSTWSTNHTNTMRLVAPLLCIGKTLIDEVVLVASVAETVIKGIANIFGSPFFKNECSFSRGCKMLTINLLGDGLKLALSSLTLLFLPIGLLIAAIFPVQMVSAAAKKEETQYEGFQARNQLTDSVIYDESTGSK
jgi:hypothetical protein